MLKIIFTTVQSFVIWATRHPGFENPYLIQATGYGLDDPGIESQWSKIFHTCPDRPWRPSSLLYNGNRVFPQG